VSRLVWIDRAGRSLETIGPPGNYLNVAIAADGRRIFYDRTRPGVGTFDIWSFDLERGVETPVTTDPDTEFAPLELRDGKSIVYSLSRGGAPQLVRRNLETGREEQLQEVARAFQAAQDVSPDGRISSMSSGGQAETSTSGRSRFRGPGGPPHCCNPSSTRRKFVFRPTAVFWLSSPASPASPRRT
jgi:Tol biopolymer transport system component